MISTIIALGSNKGNKLTNIIKATNLIKNRIGTIEKTSNIYENSCLDINSKITSNQPSFLNCALKINIKSTITPNQLLKELKSIEHELGRKDRKKTYHEPREIDLDILYYNNQNIRYEDLVIPHKEICNRLFVLLPLRDIDESILINERNMNFYIKKLYTEDYPINMIIPCVRNPLVLNKTQRMLIINCTDDSFSKVLFSKFDNDEYNYIEEKIVSLIQKYQIDILNIGGESTRPFAKIIPEEIEFERVSRMICILRKNEYTKNNIISLDTRKSKIVDKLIKDIDIINDVSGLRFDKNMIDVVAKNNIPYIYMHSRADPTKMTNQVNLTYNNLIEDIIYESKKDINTLNARGLFNWNVIYDPGLGFAKEGDQNFEVIRKLKEFKIELNHPLLIGGSKKRFLGENRFDPSPNNAIHVGSIMNGANIIRLHDIELCDESITIADKIKNMII